MLLQVSSRNIRCVTRLTLRFASAAASSTDSKYSIKGLAIEGRPAYLDFQATTPLDPRVLDEMVCIHKKISFFINLTRIHSRCSFHSWLGNMEILTQERIRLVGKPSRL